MRVRVCAAVLAAFALTGCGSAEDAPPPLDPLAAISYGSVGSTAEIDCAGRPLEITGSNNSLTVRGTCASVHVRGADNRLRLARVEGELYVPGLNNTITYGGRPAVIDAGAGNRITPG